MGFPVFIPSDQVLRNHEKKSAETKVISQKIKLKKLEKTLKQQLSEEQRAFETKVFSGRKFSEIQKYLKAIRRNDGWPSNMKWGNNLAECPEEMAELLNKHFQSVFSPGTPQNNVNYLQPLQIDCISTVKVTEEKIKLILESLCVSKSAGPDGISPQVL